MISGLWQPSYGHEAGDQKAINTEDGKEGWKKHGGITK